MIHDECRLDQLLLTELLEEQVHDVALLVALLVLYVMLVSDLLRLSVISNLIKINTCIFLDSVNHSQTLKWLAKVDLDSVVGDLGASTYLLCEVTEHGLCELHHTIVICVCLVQLHQSELRVVTCVNTLVTEYSSDLVYSLKTADDKSLQVELK